MKADNPTGTDGGAPLKAGMEPNYKHDVFISYYHEDEPHARRLFEKMDAFGLRVFWSPKTLDRGVEFQTISEKRF